MLQNLAWNFAEPLGWDDTFTAEYVALTKLQADAFVTLDPGPRAGRRFPSAGRVI